MDNLWDNLTPADALAVTSAQSKRPSADAPTQQPMRAGIKPAQQRKPSGDQKKHRRQMSRQAGASRTVYCPECGGPLVGSYEHVTCDKCSREYEPVNYSDSLILGLEGGEVWRIGPGDILKAVEYDYPGGANMMASRKTADALQDAVRKGMMIGMPVFTHPDAMLPDFAWVATEPGPNGARPTDQKTTDRAEANRWAEELLARPDWSPYSKTSAADGPYSIWAADESSHTLTDHDAKPEWDTSTAHDICETCGWPVSKGKDGKWTHDAKNPVHWTDKRTTSTTTKESSTMTAQPTEADLLQRLAAAKTMNEQTEAQNALEAFRAQRRESLAAEGSLWGGLDEPLPPSLYAQSALSSIETGSLPPATASVHLGHTEATDWLDDLTPTHTEDAVLSAKVRAQASRWFTDLWDEVKADHREFSSQAHNAASRTAMTYGLQHTAAHSVFLDQIGHLASREGIALTALEDSVPTYVSDGRDSLPVGVSPSDAGDTMDEWEHGTDNNSADTDPKTKPGAGEAPSLSEGTSPETGSNESGENPTAGQDADASSHDGPNAPGNTDDKAMTQRSSARKGPGPGPNDTKCTKCHGKGWTDWPSGVDMDPMPMPDCDRCKGTGIEPGSKSSAKESSIFSRIRDAFSRTADNSPDSTDGLGGINEGSTPETGHQEGFQHTPPRGDLAKGSPTDPDSIDTGGKPGSNAATGPKVPGTPTHASLAEIGTSFRGRPVSANTRTFAASLERCASIDDEVGGVSARQIVSLLVQAPDVPAGIKRHLSAHLHTAGTGFTLKCTNCGSVFDEGAGTDEGFEGDSCPDCHEGRLTQNDDPKKQSTRRTAAEHRPLYEIAADIRRNWPNVYFGAVPYLEALGQLSSMDDRYYEDDAYTIVAYLLSNMGSKFRGPEADRLKAELKALPKKRYSSRTAGDSFVSESGHTCANCGGKIERDPEGEKNRGWHHADGSKHEHEARPGGDWEDSSKAASRGDAAPFAREAITRTPPGPGWDDLKPGDKIRVGFEEHARNGTFVRLEKNSNEDFYGSAPVVVYTDESGRERSFIPTGHESPRKAKASKEAAGPVPPHQHRFTSWGDCAVQGCSVTKGQTQTSGGGYVGDPKREHWGAKQGGTINVPENAPPPGTPKAEVDAYWSWVGQMASDSDSAYYVPLAFDSWRRAYWDDEKSDTTYAGGLPPMASSLSPAFASLVQAGLGQVEAGGRADHSKCDHHRGFCEVLRERSLKEPFSISDAKNEDGEWIMSPEQIRSEMNYGPGGAYHDPYDEEMDPYYEGSLHMAGSTAQPEEGTVKDIQSGNGGQYKRAKCKNCGGQIDRKDQFSSGWTHRSTNTKNCPEGSRTAAGNVVCPYCDYTGSHDEVGKHIEDAGDAHKSKGSVTDQLNDKINRGGSKQAMPSPAEAGIEIGDIYYSSWGYDQTNIDFYEVTRLMGASVAIRPIQSRVVSEEVGGAYVVAVPGAYTGGEETKRVRGDFDGFSLNSYSNAYRWDGKPEFTNSGIWGR